MTGDSFRDRALGDPPSPLEHIGHLFHQTSRRIWLGVLGLALLIGAGVLWMAIATQSVIDDGLAVIVPPQRIFTAGDVHPGVVSQVRAREGALVRAGEQLGTISAADGHELAVRSPITGRVVALGMTRIVVAHRLSTIVGADRILVLDRGRIVEDGTYDELMARGGAFHSLASRQLL